MKRKRPDPIQHDAFAPPKLRGHRTANQRGASEKSLHAISLFSSAGIGELGIEAAGIKTVCASEIVPYRVGLYRENFPQTPMVEGDIWKYRDQIVETAEASLSGKELFLVYATPPCQGMSSNGLGRLKFEEGRKRDISGDPRNRLVIPALDVIKRLRPRWVLFENVPGMRFTEITDEDGRRVKILDYIAAQLGSDYVGGGEVVACEDFGVPQRRKRLITMFTRDHHAAAMFRELGGSFISRTLFEPRVTLRDAVHDLPPLEATAGKSQRLDFSPDHYVNVIEERKLWWIFHTPEGETAYNNQCVNPQCLYQLNALHRDGVTQGRATSSKTTPVYCERCGELLPRPSVLQEDGTYRLLKGFHSAYRRMKWDEPARTLTQNFIYEASDNKIHPSQNRVLSVHEALIVQTVSRYHYRFDIAGARISNARIAEVLGESVPPYLIEKLCRWIISISEPSAATT